jgi:hypothetical protein
LRGPLHHPLLRLRCVARGVRLAGPIKFARRVEVAAKEDVRGDFGPIFVLDFGLCFDRGGDLAIGPLVFQRDDGGSADTLRVAACERV